ncbi:MAG: hypothetical protein VCF25_26650, partial [Candidatus Poribacteria bacterium]
FLCAVGARNGDLIWQEKMSGFSPQGYLLSSSEQLYVQNSRGNPFVFRRAMVSIFILLVVVEGLLP